MKLRPQARRHGRQPSPQVSEQEMQIRKGLESMRDATAREVMTPRVDVVALDVPVTLDDVARARAAFRSQPLPGLRGRP